MVKRTVTAKDDPFAYTAAGLQGIFLYGIDVFHCPACGLESPRIPNIGGLHRLIARDLIRQPGLLRGSHVRFLRKNAGVSSKDFSELLGIGVSHLSRVENGKHQHLGASADKLVRAFAFLAVCGETGRVALEKLIAAKRSRTQTAKRVVFRVKNNRWQKAA